MTSLCYFGGFNSQDFVASYPQFNSPVSREELYNVYKRLTGRDILYFNYSQDRPTVEVVKLS
ncbi:hypothetical protein FACS189472_14530 [Alphaproteobacteria bacterium]|nr:hypothetical protein FACS189472_14530 [Alphaproteobacteria bacterium]